ncbi:hypothetical protein ACSNOK_34955, partial [Streptomyces sp. URMC 126]
GDVRVRGIDVHDGTHYPLSLVAWQFGPRLTLRVDHRTDVYGTADAKDLAARLVQELERIATSPEAPVGTATAGTTAGTVAEATAQG